MKRILFVSLLLVFTSLWLNGCDRSSKDDEIIKIGVTLDFTGPNSVYGQQVQQGIDLAVGQINSGDGVDGKKIEILYQDSKSDPKLAVSNALKFTSIEKCKILLGEISSNATQAMIPIVEESGAFLFAPASSSPKLTNISSNFARNWPSDLSEAGSAAKFAWNSFNATNASIIYVNSDYGIGLKNKFTETFQGLGGEVQGAETYAVNSSDFRTLLNKVKTASPEVIYLAGNPKEMGRCIKQMRELQISLPVISNTGFLQTDCLTLAGGASEGVVVPTPSYTPMGNSETKNNFYNAFTEQYGSEPTMIHANAYDAIYLIRDAIIKSGYDGLKIAEYIRNKKNYQGAAGKVSFTNGDVEVPITFKTIKNGQPVMMNSDAKASE